MRRARTTIAQILQDVRYAVRGVRKQPGTTAIIVVSLALGIGANTMVFSLVNAILLRSLPYPEPDRLVQVWFTPPGQPGNDAVANATICLDMPKKKDFFFKEAGCYLPVAGNIADPADAQTTGPEWLNGEMLTWDLVQAVGVKPMLGRWFTREEDHGDAEKVMLISYELWQRRFNGAADILSRRLRVTDFGGNDSPAAIIGVMPPGYLFANPSQAPDYVVPLRASERGRNSPVRNRLVVARLKDGMSLEQAQEHANRLAIVLGEESPRNKGWGMRIEPIIESRVGGIRSAFQILQGTAALVLLIACANVGGLLLAQGIQRQRELAVRAAIGSGRGRILRQLLTESMVLAALGAIVCIAIVSWGMGPLVKWLPAGLPRLQEVSVDTTVLLFTAGVAILTSLVFGLLPALQASRLDLASAFNSGSRSATSSRSKLRMRSAFVVVQVATALVLLTGAGLLINSLVRLLSTDPGFNTSHLTTFQMSFTGREFFGATGRVTPLGSLEFQFSPRINTITNELRDRIAALPGVDSVTTMRNTSPMDGGRGVAFTIAGRAPVNEDNRPRASWVPIGADYFTVLGLRVRQGREFTDRDNLSSPPVALISAAMARTYFDDQDPVGQTISIDFYNDQPRQIVGIVPDIVPDIRDRTPQPQIYVPHTQLPLIQAGITAFGLETVNFVVRSNARIEDWLPQATAAAKELDPAHAISGVQLVEDFAAQQTQGFRQYVILLGVFSSIALLLAVIGVYGVMSHSVTARTNEIGIRVAFGATWRNVLTSVVGRGMALIGLGVLLGLTASIGMTKLIASALFGVTPTDPVTYGIVLGVFFIVACLACLVPARRALQVDPLVAMRAE